VPMLPGQVQAHQVVVRDEGDFTLLLTAQPDASQLELAWPPIMAVQAQSAMRQPDLTQQLSLQQFAAQLQMLFHLSYCTYDKISSEKGQSAWLTSPF